MPASWSESSIANYQDSRGKFMAQPGGWLFPDSDQKRRGAGPRVDNQSRSGREPQTLHLTQSGGVFVRDTADHRGYTAGPFRQWNLFANRNRAVFFRNDVSVRIDIRIAEFGRNTIFQAF